MRAGPAASTALADAPGWESRVAFELLNRGFLVVAGFV
jgi:hypothetical protein